MNYILYSAIVLAGGKYWEMNQSPRIGGKLSRAVRYHPKHAYHDTIALVSRYTLGIDTLDDDSNQAVKFGLLHHLAYDNVHK